MGLMSRVLDFMDGDNRPQWQKGGWGTSQWEPDGRLHHQSACIMGIFGLVLHSNEFLISGEDFREVLGETLTDQERKELLVLLETVHENYPEWSRIAMGEHVVPGRCTNMMLIDYLVDWNDSDYGAQTFEGDVLPMLEKTAIRIAEKGTEA